MESKLDKKIDVPDPVRETRGVGWDVFDRNWEGVAQVQRIDCPNDGDNPMFDSDEEAYECARAIGYKVDDNGYVTMNRYHFDFGNSTDGPIGFCVAIWAPTRDRAVELLRDAFAGHEEMVNPGALADGTVQMEGLEYCQVYFGDDALTASGIDEVQDADGNVVDETEEAQ